MRIRLALDFERRGPDVAIRAPRPRDAAGLARVRSESWSFLAPWNPLRDRSRSFHGEARRTIASARANWRADRSYAFLVTTLDDRIVGQVTLNNVVRAVLLGAELGYWIAPTHVKRGLASQAVALALDTAFGELGLHRVQAGIMPSNLASLALARKIGFREEGLARRMVRIAGSWEDHVLFALTEEEWATRLA